MVKLNKPQRLALYKIWLRNNYGMTYRAFRKTVQPAYNCVMVKWGRMWLGIETDGYTHS